ncbi:M28 family metallopeptidase [candidate division CSSED10-310 bacterium]|uniref:M28 family metallopeptidase n=1 Tax=candidate division CSSED10-310 bacterium TaxID=2855610 RepID=A0ABV6YTR6_UNCC1
MDKGRLTRSIQTYLEELCVKLPHRHVGSSENKQATTFFRKTAEANGLETELQQFDCFDWYEQQALLTVGDVRFRCRVSPYSLPFTGNGELVLVRTIDELADSILDGHVVLLKGEIASQQIMPKNFVFFNPDEHKRIVSLLEEKQPAAIIAAPGRDLGLAGGTYPFPLFEDGDFDIPSVYMKDVESEQLATYAGATVSLSFRSERIPSHGENVIAKRLGSDSNRIVIAAHIDSKKDSPGAIDNATGVAVLLALGECLSGTEGPCQIELTALNGEDYYAVPGQMLYLAKNNDRMESIRLAINLDGAGYSGVPTAWSTYGADEMIEAAVGDTVDGETNFIVGEPWPQGDHMLFAMNGRPAIALTTGDFSKVMDVTHTSEDTIDIVDPAILAGITIALKNLILRLEDKRIHDV